MKQLTREEQLAARREAYRAMSPERYAERRKKENEHARMKRNTESPEEREKRLAPMRERARLLRQAETPEQREKRLAYFKKHKPKYVAANKHKLREAARAYYEANKERIIACGKEYRKKTRAAAAARERRKRKENPVSAIASRLRCRLRSAVKCCGAAKAESTFSLVGCTPAELVSWIERQFETGMNWENRHLWHIDHIIPCNAFDLSDPSQQAVAFHFSNLRPLWAIDNIRKKDRIPVPQKKFFWTLKDVSAARAKLGGLAAMHVAGPRMGAA